VIAKLRELRRKFRCRWSDCAVLYRTHVNRDQLAAQMVRQGIPFTIENMDVMDTPEARDLFACLGAVVSDADGASLFRVAALPQFAIDPEKLRSGIKALPRDAGTSAIALVLSQIEDGGAVLERVRQTRAHCRLRRQRPCRGEHAGARFCFESRLQSAASGPRLRERMGKKSNHENP
jgi:ATP-dependent exoDNAse (exonuclease V) beta subunit